MTDRAAGYAAAVLDLARAEDSLEVVEQELFALSGALEKSKELRDALGNPQLPAERKAAIIDDLIGKKASSVTVGVVQLVVGQGRSSELPAIVDSFVAQAAATRQKVVAEVRSAIPLDKATITRLEGSLGRVTGRSVEVKVVVDETVLGGLVAQVGDTVFDGSVEGRLKGLRRILQRR